MNTNELNKVVNIDLKGGLIGLFTDSPQKTLDKAVKKQNSLGYKVVQIIPAHSGNVLLFILRLFLLVITLFFYTTANGFYLVLERSGDNNNATLNKDAALVNAKQEEANIDDLFN